MTRRPPTELKRDRNSAFVRWKGEKIYFGPWGERETSRNFAKWLADVSERPEAPAPKHLIVLADCVELYLLHAEAYYPPQEFVNIRTALGHLEPYYRKSAVDFGPRTLKDLQKYLAKLADKDGEQVYARTTINSKIDRIRRCFKWCASEELIPTDVVTALATVQSVPKGRGMARETDPIAAVDPRIVVLTLPFLSPTTATMVRVQYLCGMRPQDVCRMTSDAIDRSGDVWLYRPTQHKGSHRGGSLTKAIPKVAQELLLPFLKRKPSEPLFSPQETRDHFNLKHTSGKRRAPTKQYTTASYGKAIVYAIARAARCDPPMIIPHWTPNQLRHAIATDVRAESGIEAAQAYLGHARPDTTLIYAEQTESALLAIAANIASPLGPAEVAHR